MGPPKGGVVLTLSLRMGPSKLVGVADKPLRGPSQSLQQSRFRSLAHCARGTWLEPALTVPQHLRMGRQSRLMPPAVGISEQISTNQHKSAQIKPRHLPNLPNCAPPAGQNGRPRRDLLGPSELARARTLKIFNFIKIFLNFY